LAERFREELIKIGGWNIFGYPILRWAWGQTTFHFAYGKERLLYRDDRIPPLEIHAHVLKKIAYIKTKRIHDQKLGKFVVKEEPVWQERHVPEEPKIIPQGWLYEKVLTHLEFIGEQLWYIEQWKPPEHFGSKLKWDRMRYGQWDLDWPPDVKLG